ncbi:MAG: gliding motility-associated C-terminal domain-containing protein [Flavobacteriales bacterium]
MNGAASAPAICSISRTLGSLCLILLSSLAAAQQQGPATRGKRFWTGFVQNGFGANSLKVHVLTTVATNGTVSMPGTGWSSSFTAGPNAVAVLDIPLTAEHFSSGVLEQKGILITTQDSVDVHIGSFQNWTQDMSQILPEPSLGTRYRVSASAGVPNFNNLHHSEFLIVATEDGTEVSITPSVATMDGRPANIPYTIQLDAGDSYQVKALSDSGDLTGSLVEGTETSGPCRPFVVIGGATCGSVPAGCAACDVVFDQLLPIPTWGTKYYTVPVQGVNTATYRILAHEDNTVVSIGGSGSISLNAGQSHTVTGSVLPRCIEADRPIMVTQFMEGYACASIGDPSMVVLSPVERISRNASFHVTSSAQTNQFRLSVVMPSSAVGTLTLDGATVSPGLFQPYPDCAERSFASITVTSGVHRIQASAGFQAYLFGYGWGESYATTVHGIGIPAVQQDSLVCGGGTVTLSAPFPLSNAVWSNNDAPTVPIGVGPSITLTPTGSASYTVTGEVGASGCPRSFTFHVGVPLTIPTLLTANDQPTINVCQYEPVQLSLVPPPDTAWFDIQWSPAGSLDHPDLPGPIATPQEDTWYRVSVQSPSGCGDMVDSILVQVTPAQVLDLRVSATAPVICAGMSTMLSGSALRVMAMDNFNTGTAPIWTAIQGGGVSQLCGSQSGSALRFDGSGQRSAQTIGINTTNGGEVRFHLKLAEQLPPCDGIEAGEHVVLEYSTNNGFNWTLLASYLDGQFPDFTPVVQEIPPAAQSMNTMFRLRQLAHSGAGQDNWAFDEFFVARMDSDWLTNSWSGPGIGNTTASSLSITPASTGWYVLHGVDPTAGCTYTDSVQVTVQPAFTIALPGDTTICDGLPVLIQSTSSDTNGVTYQWTPANAGLSATNVPAPTASPATTTTYTLQASNAFGCTSMDQITVTVGGLIGLAVTADQTTICPGSTVQLTALASGGAGLTYAWSGPAMTDPTAATTFATPSTTSTYTCTVTEAGSGCMRSANITITVNAGHTANAGIDVHLCSTLGYQLQVVHNVPQASISWQPASNLNVSDIADPSIVVDESATYIVTVTDINGCSVTDSVLVSRPFEGLPLDTSLVRCANDIPILSAPSPAGSYLWSTGATTPEIVPDGAGEHMVTMTDADGCSWSTTYVLVLNPMPTVELGPDQQLCGISELTLVAGPEGPSYLWDHGATGPAVTITASGDYAVTATSSEGCSVRDSVSITLLSAPVDPLEDIIQCATTPTVLDAGNPGASYLWSTGATTQTITVSESGNYSVVVTGPQNCSATFDAVVTLSDPPTVDLGPDRSICNGTSTVLGGAASGPDHLWSTGATTPSIEVSDAGTYWLQVSNGACMESDTIVVELLPLPEDVLVDVQQCRDIPAVLLAGGPQNNYNWSTGATTPSILVSTSGTYSVQVTGPNGCTASHDVVVTLIAPPVVQLGPDTVLCEGEVLQLDAGNPGASHLWSTGARTRRLNVTTSGTYSVTVDNGCVRTDAITVQFNPSPARLAAREFHTCLDDEPKYVILDAGNSGSSYLWSTGATSQVIMAGAYGTYYVQITNLYDCTVRDSAQVIEFCPATIFVPNTFTPNGDGLNDVFTPVGKNIADFTLRVFDRWGELLYETSDLNMGWDGTYRGTVVKNDMYVWRMTYRFYTDEDGSIGFEQSQMGQIQVLY